MTVKEEFIEAYVQLDKHDRDLVDEFLDALLADDKEKCDRMMREAQAHQKALVR